jgi:hypothetical protein
MGGMGGMDPSNMDPEDLQEAAKNMDMGDVNAEDVVDADYEEVEDKDEEKKD